MFRAIRYDLRFGIYESKKQYLFIALFSVFIFVCFIFDAIHLSVLLTGGVNDIRELSVSLGDAILLELGACLPISQSAAGFTFPTMWFLSMIVPCYLTLNYTAHDLGAGIQVITRLKGKNRWWISKCVLSTATVVLYYLILYTVIAILCFVCGFELSFMPDEEIFLSRFNAIFLSADVTDLQMFLALCLMPGIVTAALSLVQMMLTLFIKPIFAYLLICAYLAGTVLCVYPLFIANFAMPVRTAAVGIYNFDFASCLVYSAIISVAAIVIGGIRIAKMDIL